MDHGRKERDVMKLDAKKAGTTALTSVVFVLLGMGTAPGSGKSTGTTGEKPKVGAAARDTPGAEDKSPDVTVSAKTLLKAYQDNLVTADANYKGKRLRVDGKLHEITTAGLITGAEMTLNGGEFEANNVTCKFNEAPPGAEHLSTGNSVIVDGDCSGRTNIGLVLDNCRLVSP